MWGGWVYAECGVTVGNRTSVVVAAVGADGWTSTETDGVLVSRFRDGWRAWEQLYLG
jgi:hypothetical protein